MANTSTVGGVISGYCAIGRLKTEIPPARVMMIDSTEAKIGRSMKNRENTAYSRQKTDKETRRQGDKENGGYVVSAAETSASGRFRPGSVSLSPCLFVSLSSGRGFLVTLSCLR